MKVTPSRCCTSAIASPPTSQPRQLKTFFSDVDGEAVGAAADRTWPDALTAVATQSNAARVDYIFDRYVAGSLDLRRWTFSAPFKRDRRAHVLMSAAASDQNEISSSISLLRLRVGRCRCCRIISGGFNGEVALPLADVGLLGLSPPGSTMSFRSSE